MTALPMLMRWCWSDTKVSVSLKRIEVRFEPLNEFGDAVMQGGGGLVAALALKL